MLYPHLLLRLKQMSLSRESKRSRAFGLSIIYRARTGQCVIPDLADTWHWSFAFYAVLGFLGVIIAGFVLEAVAGFIELLIEWGITRPLWGAKGETLRKWYRKYIEQPDPKNAARAQKWIWKSAQAYQEFSRRRLRILFARNTAIFLFLFTLFWLSLVSWSFCLFFVGLSGSAVFAWLWIDAQKGWNRAVNITEQLEGPTEQREGP